MKKLPTLYDLTATARELTDKLIESGGEITEELARDLAENTELLESKAVGYAFTLDNISSQISQIEDMEKQIRERKKALKASKDRLSTALLDGLRIAQIEKIEAPSHRITVGKKRATLEILDENLIPELYKEHIVKIELRELEEVLNYFDLPETVLMYIFDKCNMSSISDIDTKIDKKELLQDLKEGKEIPGVKLIDNEKQLYIK